ncbi:MAG: DUF4395 domain-containing protein [Bacteroidales bacterium]|nr:DUF4395 domain-containing protein [Bacteroidales bacterium]
MEKYCPIISETVDTKLIKVNASFVLTILVLSVATPWNWLIYIVTADFAIRVFLGIKNSPVCMVIRKSMKVMDIKQHKVNAGPKKLASKFGLVFSLMIIGFQLLNFPIVATSITAIFIILTALEVFFSYCLVCTIYPYLNRIGIK